MERRDKTKMLEEYFKDDIGKNIYLYGLWYWFHLNTF
jgi:hypothetical protein